MPDDKQPPGPGAGAGDDRTLPGGRPDDARAYRPDDTRPIGPDARAYRPDDTRPIGADETRPFQPDETRPFQRSGPGDTHADPGWPPAEPAVWSGRAEVPPAGLRRAGPPATQWEPPPDEGGRRWWMPIVIGLVGLLLLGVLGYGLWLIASAGEEAGPVASPTPAAPTARPTTAAPTTEAPEPTGPQEVEVPDLVGEPLTDAQDRLDELDLTHRVEFEVTDEEEPGTVLRTEPAPGELVEPGSRVTLIVATAPQETAPPGPTATAEESPQG